MLRGRGGGGPRRGRRRTDEGAGVAYDEVLAERVRATLADVPLLVERKMFGGLAFMAGDHMVCGIIGDGLLARIGPDAVPAALERPGVREMDFTGRPMRAMVIVEAAALDGDAELAAWVGEARAFVATLPPKRPDRRRPPA